MVPEVSARGRGTYKNGEYLAAELNKIPGLRRLPKDDRITQRGYYFLVLDFDAEAFGCSREKFLQALQAEGVWWAGAGYNRPLHKEQLRPFEEPDKHSRRPRPGVVERQVRRPLAGLCLTGKVADFG
ncbi:MAG: hypothetical protein HYY08_03905 [Firmicutes bacterium]|nr:hypothetical protein [Bacillota bacterium]